MSFTDTGEELTIRRAWLMEVNRRSQEFAGLLVPGEDLPEPEDIDAFVRTLPRAANVAEISLLKARLLDLALRWTVFTHARFHGGRRCCCSFATLEPLAGGWRIDPRWDVAVARQWADACAEIGERLRDRQNARRLASELVERHREHHALTSHAEQLGAAPRALARTFRDEFGCTPHAFLTRVRVARAVPKLASGDKTESVASEVGYRSKKDLFGALRKLTGLRPSEVQRLSAEQVATIVERLEPGRN